MSDHPHTAENAYEHCDGSPVQYVYLWWNEDTVMGVYSSLDAAAQAAEDDGDQTPEIHRFEVRHG